MASVAETSLSYTPEDLQWLRAEVGVAHLELDPWNFAEATVRSATGAIELVIAGAPRPWGRGDAGLASVQC